MNSEEKTEKIKYPIGAKLVVIITIICLFIAGAITVLVSVLVSEDVRVTAEDNNFTANKRSAQEAESYLGTVRGNTLMLLDTLNALGTASTVSGLVTDFFFERNQQIAFVGIVRSSLGGHNLIRNLVNEKFFLSNELESTIINTYIESNQDILDRCWAGETILVNAAPVFNTPVLALFYPWREAGRRDAAVMIFSANSLTENFSEGANLSYMINDTGSYLVHGDYELIRAGAQDVSEFSAMLLESADISRQTLYRDANGNRYFGAYRKISVANASVITIIPYDVVFEGVTATTRRNIFLTGAVLFIAVLFVWFFSKTVSVPLKALAAAAEQIEGGNFEFDIKPKTKDEVGFLTKSFQKMTGALSVFGRFTNREIAVKAMRGEIQPGGLQKHATIFFSDIRGFTEKSEVFTKEFGNDASNRIIIWLNQYFTQMVDCVEKTNGVVDKFIGDAVMAHWGTAYTAGSPAKDAFNGVKAALMMRNALYRLNQTKMPGDRGNPQINIGCGLNTGLVTAGQLGSDQRMEYTVIGDPVNLASRIEALNKPLGTDILISENTWKLIGKHFITEEMPPVTVKGKAKPVRLFAVVNLKGSKGPQSLAEVRKLLGITPPDMSKVDTSAEEKKYKIGGDK